MKPFGQIAYEAYAERANGLSLISGQELPAWNDVALDIQVAWEAAAQAVLNATEEAAR